MSSPLAPRARGGLTPVRPQRDVVALVFGLLLTGIAGTTLWISLVGPLSWRLLTTAAPLALVVIGIVGLLLSRRR